MAAVILVKHRFPQKRFSGFLAELWRYFNTGICGAMPLTSQLTKFGLKFTGFALNMPGKIFIKLYRKPLWTACIISPLTTSELIKTFFFFYESRTFLAGRKWTGIMNRAHLGHVPGSKMHR